MEGVRIRILDKNAEEHRNKRTLDVSTPCKVCGKDTHNRKPYCPKHLDKNDYIRSLMDQVKKSNKENESVGRKGKSAIKIDSFYLEEIRSILRAAGAKTIFELAKDLVIKDSLARVFVSYLFDKGELVSSGNYIKLAPEKPNEQS